MDYFTRKVKAIVTSVQSLFTKLNEIRVDHENRPDVSGLSAEFDIPDSLEEKNRIKTEVISSLKNDLNTLITGIPNINDTTKTHYNKIEVPDVEDLLKASDFNSIIDTINALDTLCPDCNNCTGHCGSHCPDCGSNNSGCSSDHGNFSHHTNHGDNSRCANYTDSGNSDNSGGYVSNHGSKNLSGKT